jgi:hypothetical protein
MLTTAKTNKCSFCGGETAYPYFNACDSCYSEAMADPEKFTDKILKRKINRHDQKDHA